MIFDEISLTNLREKVKQRLSEKRYDHTLGVERMATYIGEIMLPEAVSELKIAALLHDIAKEIPFSEQLELLVNSDVLYSDEDLKTKPALHSFAAVPLITRDFPEYATSKILSGVLNHTLGAPGMSLFDEIIFISDYAEDGRTYPICREVNHFIKENIRHDCSFNDNLLSLHEASLTAINSTVQSLQKRGEIVNSRTILTKGYLEKTNSKNYFCAE